MRGRLLAGVLALIALAVAFPSAASAFELGVQDQGAAPADLQRVADGLGARTVRIVAAAGQPHLDDVSAARGMGRPVQAAIVVKRSTSVGDVRWLMQQWRGQVRTVSVGNEPELNGVPACVYARFFARASAMIRREFPGTVIGVGEFSPVGAREYLAKMLRCHVRIRAAFVAVHPYSFVSDPLAAPTELTGVPGASWLGIGNLSSLVRQMRRSPALHVTERLPRCTEFAYLVSGRYKITPERAAWAWPRAIRQARKWCAQLIVYGTGPVHEGSSWGSAGLLDRFDRVTDVLRALAGAVGRAFPLEPVAPVPSGDYETPLPSGSLERVPPLPAPPAEGASVDPPALTVPDPPVDAPAPVEPAPAPDVPAEPVVIVDPVPSPPSVPSDG